MKKLLAVLLFAVSVANADLGVIVSQSGTVVGKEVYAGDTSGVAGALLSRQLADPTLNFNTFQLPSSTFDSTAVPIDQAKYRTDALNQFNTDYTATSKFIRAAFLVTFDEVNVLRVQAGLAPRTLAQFRTAVQTKLNSGAAD